MTSSGRGTGYIHGYDPREVDRLVRQARTLAPWTLAGVAFPEGSRVLEVGCGVGAELALLSERQPSLKLLGADLAASQLAAARAALGPRVPLLQARGERLPFPDHSLDGIFTCWLLEHVPDPAAVVAECRRVLKPGAAFHAREVDNASFRVHPESPAVDRFMEVVNRVQQGYGGDPFVGRRLHALLLEAGFGDVRVTLPAIYSDATSGALHRELCAYFHDLLASMVRPCVAAGLEPAVAEAALAHLAGLSTHSLGAVVHVPRFASAVA